MNRTQNNGITLIALIITIIIMLILVGITISIAVNGGLFQRANDASYQTKAATFQEQVMLDIATITTDIYADRRKTNIAKCNSRINNIRIWV